MGYDVRINFRANEEQARILRAIQREHGAKSMSAAMRLAVAKAGETLKLAPVKPEHQRQATP